MLNGNWRPSYMEKTEESLHRVSPPEDGLVSPHDAERLMVIYQSLSEEWADHYANATYYKENSRFKRDAAFNLAFMQSEGKSDKQKEIDAKNNPTVRVADSTYSEAVAALKFAELRYDGSVRAYHAMKKILEVGQEEKKYL